MIFLLLIVGIVCAFISAAMASSRGRSPVLWWFLGLFFGIFAIAALAIIGKETKQIIEVRENNYLSNIQPVGITHQKTRSVSNNPYLESSSPPHTAAVQKDADQTSIRWAALKDVDPEIAAAAQEASSLGIEFERELSNKYLALNDKSYLPALLVKLREKAASTSYQQSNPIFSGETLTIYNEYMSAVASKGDNDPGTGEKVSAVEPYRGDVSPFHNGIKVQLQSGKVRLISKKLDWLFDDEDAINRWGKA